MNPKSVIDLYTSREYLFVSFLSSLVEGLEIATCLEVREEYGGSLDPW